MAHNCPTCYQACYCGGDIDDCFFEDSKEERACTCCLGKEDLDDDDDYDDEPEDDDELPPDLKLGICCICLTEHPTVRNVLTLNVRAPVPGSGWGCFQCGLPMDGAIAVLCDGCLGEHIENKRPISLACVGKPTENQRIPLASLTEPFRHDMSKHPGEA